MAYKSQGNEAEVVIDYFKDYTGALLSLGENDGVTFSNSYDLIQLGWYAILVEPSKGAYERIETMYKDSEKVRTFPFGISTKTGKQTFYETNDSLISTTKKELLNNWEHVLTVQENEVDFYSWTGVQLMYPAFSEQFDFISIDCEGMDLDILLQMDLTKIECKCICVEHANNQDTYEKIKEHCFKHGLEKELLKNGENVIFAK